MASFALSHMSSPPPIRHNSHLHTSSLLTASLPSTSNSSLSTVSLPLSNNDIIIQQVNQYLDDMNVSRPIYPANQPIKFEDVERVQLDKTRAALRESRTNEVIRQQAQAIADEQDKQDAAVKAQQDSEAAMQAAAIKAQQVREAAEQAAAIAANKIQRAEDLRTQIQALANNTNKTLEQTQELFKLKNDQKALIRERFESQGGRKKKSKTKKRRQNKNKQSKNKYK